LDAGLKHLAGLVRAQLGKDIVNLPGAGAAGGLAAGAIAFLNARLVPGIETVMRVTGFGRTLRGADWVITGEGRLDEQSLRGKVVAGVAARAQAVGARVAVLAGDVELPEQKWKQAGLAMALPTRRPGQPLAEALANASGQLADTARLLAERLV
jgi:glycerate kinase